ncbi:MAG TPA: malectin domain-containing carbohydrate-binding protein, partial [Verrucomicrobium sp.]|nr:malectin domain-containing carbohydrate-binding protein [Verrucomicrobium sp.]
MICPLSGRYTALGFSLAFSFLILHPASRVEAAPLGKKPTLPLRVNCGGGTIKDPETGALWLSDKDYVVRGKKYRFPQDLKISPNAGNPPKSVYSTVRRASVVYRFKKLPDGIYKVRLYFVDGKQLALRSMDFWIEGAHLVQNLNIREAAGGVNRGYVYEAVVEVKDGNGLDIRGTRGHGDDVFISAIEIQNAPAGTALTRPVEASPAPPPDLAQQLRDFADGPVKVVWARTDEE